MHCEIFLLKIFEWWTSFSTGTLASVSYNVLTPQSTVPITVAYSLASYMENNEPTPWNANKPRMKEKSNLDNLKVDLWQGQAWQRHSKERSVQLVDVVTRLSTWAQTIPLVISLTYALPDGATVRSMLYIWYIFYRKGAFPTCVCRHLLLLCL